MSPLSTKLCRGAGSGGGILGYPLDRLHEEVAYLGYHLHWSYESILQMEHRERRRWVEEIAKINQRLNTQTS
ncbi:DUF6760 family protein [Leptolyngbya sp. NK1-12]|uniref:DUF6760 family protein n=1 Tax=Leptolyngbya sp. NK1-12 TaxID=2547451 RepID=UPI00292E1451